jgi:surfeit locus 1 family protein
MTGGHWGGHWHPLLIPAVTTALMLALACSLGVWQVHRLAWKTALLAAIDRAEAGPAIELPAEPPMFAKVKIEGKFLAGRYALYGADVGDTPSGPRMGARLIMALQPADGRPSLLVDRGWVPVEGIGSVTLPDGIVSLEGYIRLPDRPGLFSASDNPAQHRFFTLDPAAIGPALGLARVAPFVLVALGPAKPGAYPQPAQTLPRPSNDHLSYAITWFGLGLTLAIVFLLYCRKVLRE